MSPASTKHGQIAFRLAFEMGIFVKDKDRGEIYAAETGFTIFKNPDTVRAPDVAFIVNDRIPDEGVPETGFWAIVPDLVAEIISPHDRLSEVQDKVTDYLTAGVRLVWLVDPQTRTVTTYHSLKDVQVLIEDDVLDGGKVLPGFRLPLSTIFQ